MSDIFTLPLACYAFSFVVKVKLQGKKKNGATVFKSALEMVQRNHGESYDHENRSANGRQCWPHPEVVSKM